MQVLPISVSFRGKSEHWRTVARQLQFTRTRFPARRRHLGITSPLLCAEHMTPSIARRRVMLGVSSSGLRPEDNSFYEHELCKPPRPCGPRMRQSRKMGPEKSRLIPAMPPAHNEIGIYSHEMRARLYFYQPLAPIFGVPGQPGYGDKRPS
jgi:hypothetical protein